MLKSIYSKSLLIATLLIGFTDLSRAQSFKRYGGRDNGQLRLEQRSRQQRYYHDDFRAHRFQKGNRFRQNRYALRNRCVPGMRSRAFRNGFRNGFSFRREFENRNFRNRGFRENRLGDRGRRGGRIRSL